MSKRDYELIGKALRNTKPIYDSPSAGASEYAETLQWRQDVLALAAVMEKQSLRFRRESFLLACNY